MVEAKAKTLALLTLGVALAAQHGPAHGEHGAVASAEVHASQVGIDIMKTGGNAVDAAVAVGFALAVTHPFAGNIGGGGFMTIRLATGETAFLDYREEAPSGASRDMYLDAQGNVLPRGDIHGSITGYRASGVPGSVAGMAEAAKKYGKLTLAQDMAPAIELAEDGFELSYSQAQSLHSRNMTEFPDSRRVFQRGGDFYKPDELFRQPELAATLKLIASQGPDAFYRGPIAEQLAAFEAANGGLITRQDLSDYQAKWRDPLTADYEGYHIVTAPPASSGGIALIEMLNMLSLTHYTQAGMNAASTLHTEIEAMRRAFADRAVYLGDTDFAKVPVATLISPEYARQRWVTFNPTQASPSKDVGAGDIPGYESEETTHYSVVDAAGDAVAVSTTLNDGYGSGVTAGHLGFLLNDEMDDFTSKPGVPNMFGLLQSKVNAIEPHKRPLSAMTPTIVTKDGKLFLVLGSPGGPKIITAVFEVLTNVIDFKLNLQQAVDAPRFHQQWMPDSVDLEAPGFSPDTIDLLKKMGYTLTVRGSWCDVESIEVDASGARLAATDPRANGAALVY